MKRVVVTGLGAITPLGNSVNEFWENIKAGKSGAGLVDINSFVMPPKTIEVWAGENAGKMRLVKTITPPQPVAEKPAYFTAFDLVFSPVNEQLFKVVIRPVSQLPKWHKGKGEKAWVFVDELFVN